MKDDTNINAAAAAAAAADDGLTFLWSREHHAGHFVTGSNRSSHHQVVTEQLSLTLLLQRPIMLKWMLTEKQYNTKEIHGI